MFKKKVYDFINSDSWFQKFIYILIILNVLSLILASYKEILGAYKMFFGLFELFSVVVFSIEYVLRLWTADLHFEKGTSLKKRLKFAFSTYGIIDLIAILPFYLPLIFPFDLRVLRILRLFRLLRIFKLGRLSKSLQTIMSVLKDSRSELSLTLFVAFILLILSSTLMFYVENAAQPEKFENIGQSLWWSVATLTTVGYGDIYPITPWGKLLSSAIAIIGIGVLALPTGIISSAFINRIAETNKEEKGCECPNCGTKF